MLAAKSVALVSIMVAGILLTLVVGAVAFLDLGKQKAKKQKQLLFIQAPLTFAPDFPIDLVYTWVDGTDEAWRKSVAASRLTMNKRGMQSAHTAERDPTSLARDELFYSVRLALLCMPFIRRIFIVTQRPHRPSWLSADTSEKITVIHHDEFFCREVRQPTYNSSVIIPQIPFIPALSEHYILSDDDMFPLKPVTRRHYFSDAGTPVVQLHDADWVHDLSNQTPWFIALRRTSGMLAALKPNTSPSSFRVPPHQMLPLLKTDGQKMYRMFQKQALAMQGLRSNQDFIIQYLLLNAVQTTTDASSKQHVMFYQSGEAFVRQAAVSPIVYTSICINKGFSTEAAAVLEQHTTNLQSSF